MAEEKEKQTEETPAQPKPESKTEGKELSAEEWTSLLKERDAKIDELTARVESLQDSLDSALEELALRGQVPEAEPELEEEEEKFSEEETGEEKTPEISEKEGEETSTVEEEIEAAIKEDEKFREDILLREEVRDLKEEIKEALQKYPEANETEILLGIEDGIEEGNPNQVEVLAKASQERILAEKEALKKKFEEEFRSEVKKEAEGEISVPQSPGTPKVPQTPPVAPGVPSTSSLSEEAEWNEALQRAKAEGGGI